MPDKKTDRFRIDSVDAFPVSAAFIALEGKGYARKKFTPTSEVSHLEIYQYVSPSGEKLSFVYDTVAKILTVDGKAEALEKIKPVLPVSHKTEPVKGVQVVTVPANPPQKAANPQKKPSKANPSAEKNGAEKAGKQPAPPQNKQGKPNRGKSEKTEPQNPTPPKQPKPEADKPAPDGKQAAAKGKAGKGKTPPSPKQPPAKEKKNKETRQQTVTVKNVSAKRLEWVLKDLADVGVKVREAVGEKPRAFELSSGSGALRLAREDNGTTVLVGKPCGLMNDVKAQLESKSNLKLLKKHLPTALRFLSESSKIDLSNGISDIDAVPRLSDYSILLMTPCRALEKFISDLQQAENINVKMIGQAYEKDDMGKYTLKRGYLKRIGSVVYGEVMAALYTEYYATRNFYLHSDNSTSTGTRGISDKAEAQRILKKMLAVIEYNSKKLSEIGFTVTDEQ